MRKSILSIAICLCLLIGGFGVTHASGTNIELCNCDGQGYGYKISTSILYDDSYDEALSEQFGKDLRVVSIVDACFVIDDQKVYNLSGRVSADKETITVRIPITGVIKDHYTVYTQKDDKFVKLSTKVKNGYICYDTDTLQTVYIVQDLNYFSPWMIVISCIVILLLLSLIVYYFKMRRDIANTQSVVKNKEIEIEE